MSVIVSIIVPCYKQACYLPEALQSVLSQTFQDWECIIVNDGSPDKTEEVARQFITADSRIKYIYQENQGVSATRNNAVAHSTGKYILPLDADDIIMPTYLQKAVDYLESHPECNIVTCKAKMFGAMNKNWVFDDYDYSELKWKNTIMNSSVFRREDFDRTSGYNVNMVHGYEDWEFWITLLNENSKVHRLDEFLYYYRKAKNSRNINAYRHDKELSEQIVMNHLDLYSDSMHDILYYHKKLREAEEELNRIKSTPQYKAWKCLTFPLRILVDKVHGLVIMRELNAIIKK